MKIQKKKNFFFLGGGVGLGGCQGGWEWRIEAFMKIQKKNFFFFRGRGGGGGGGGGGGQGGCEQRSKEVKFL